MDTVSLCFVEQDTDKEDETSGVNRGSILWSSKLCGSSFFCEADSMASRVHDLQRVIKGKH